MKAEFHVHTRFSKDSMLNYFFLLTMCKLKKIEVLDDNDIENLIFERITEDDLKDYTNKDKEAAYIYYLMNKGYSYAEKIIKKVHMQSYLKQVRCYLNNSFFIIILQP